MILLRNNILSNLNVYIIIYFTIILSINWCFKHIIELNLLDFITIYYYNKSNKLIHIQPYIISTLLLFYYLFITTYYYYSHLHLRFEYYFFFYCSLFYILK